MPNEMKEKVVAELQQQIEKFPNFVLTDYRGLTCAQMTKLRRNLLQNGVTYHVIKNRLFKIALHNKNIEGLDDILFGPIGVAFTEDDVVTPSKVLIDFAKDSKLEIKGGYFYGSAVDGKGVDSYSKLPSKEQLYVMLLGALQAPLTKFARTISGSMQKLAIALNEVKKQKEGA